MRHSVATAIEGHYLVMAIEALEHEGVLDALARGEPLDAIAAARGHDLRVLRGLVEFVAARSDRLDGAPGYAPSGDTPAPGGGAAAAPLLDLYVGAFGPCLSRLSSTLRSPSRGGQHVDERRHAAAFAHDGAGVPPIFGALVRELQIRTLLELGCGGGALLANLASDRDFRGIGVDINPHAVEAARRRATQHGVTDRLTFVCGEMLDAAAKLSPEQRSSVDALFASSVLNGYFGWDGPTADQALARMGALFPNRIFIIADYYGRLGLDAGGHRLGLGWVHDVAQLISGQGVPPRDQAAWQAIYDRAGCTLIRAFDREIDGVSAFIHIVQLAGPR